MPSDQMTEWPELDGQRYLSLKTFKRDGTSVNTPVWFEEIEGALWVVTNGLSWKVKRLRNFSRSEIAACDSRGKFKRPGHGEWLSTETSIHTLPPSGHAAYKALRKKYGFQMLTLDVMAFLSGRRKHWVYLEIRRSESSPG